MSFPTHYRSSSPGGGRHHVAGPRASTGMVQLDPYEQRQRHYDYDDYPSDAGYASTAYRHYPIRRSPVEARPVSTQKVRESGNPAKKRTEYAIEPHGYRSRSSTVSALDNYERSSASRLAVPSQHRPMVHASTGRAVSPLETNAGHYVMPSSSHHGGHHRRTYSTDYATDTGNRDPYDRVKHRSSRHRSHRDASSSGRRRYPAHGDLKKGEEIDNYNEYSYTNPREQFDRDYPVRARRPSGRASLDRPLSMNVMEELPQWMSRKERPHGPPPTSRGFEKLDREGRPRHTRPTDDHHREASRSRGAHDRSLVVVPHDSDDGYESHGEPRRRRRHHRDYGHPYESDRPRRDDRHDDRAPAHHNGTSERALVGLGTAALGNGYSDMSDYEQQASRQHRRPRDPERDQVPTQSTSRELVPGAPASADRGKSTDRSKQLYLEPLDSHRRHRSRSHRRSRSRQTSESDGFTDDEDLRKYKREPSATPRRKHSSEDSSEDGRLAVRSRPPRERSHVRSPSRTRSSSNGSHDGGKRVVTVDPPVQREIEAQPKGILKKPKPAFPEDPNPLREGVAPLKDAQNASIPPGARWTKINCGYVSAEALRLAGERFEERDGYVIVLKVLPQDRIHELAVVSQQLRG